MKHSATKGLFLKKGIYWLAGTMVRGVRGPHISLQTRDFDQAVKNAARVRSLPNLTPTGGIKDEINRFLAHKVAQREYSKSSASSKGYVLNAWASTLPKHLGPSMVTTEQLQAYYDARLAKFAIATAHKNIMDIQAFFAHLLKTKQVRSNPALGVKTVEVPDTARHRFCTRQEQDMLINDCTREDLKLVLLLGFDAGFRKNEIIQAVPWWFHVERRSIDMQPTPTMPFNRIKRKRVIPMRQRLIDFLGSYGLRDPFLLRPEVRQGKDLYRYDFDGPLQNYVKTKKGADGKPMTWVTAHVMRHTFASLLVQENTSIFKVASWLGDSVKTTQKHYAHLLPGDDDIELHGVKPNRAHLRKPSA